MNRRKFLTATSAILGTAAVGGFYWKHRWKYIIIHHSAGSGGDIEFLQKVHRQRQPGDPVDAIPYHYIIGNGKGLGLGEIASDWRQSCHLWGSHVSSSNLDRNFRGIGICLIGNYETRTVPPEQYSALVKLTKGLMRNYNIAVENINGHGMIEGESTKCPGKYFPMAKFRKDIA